MSGDWREDLFARSGYAILAWGLGRGVKARLRIPNGLHAENLGYAYVVFCFIDGHLIVGTVVKAVHIEGNRRERGQRCKRGISVNFMLQVTTLLSCNDHSRA